MATTYNLYIDQGTTFSSNVQYRDSRNNPISLAGYTAYGQMQKSYDSANAAAVFAVSIIDAANGTVNLGLTAADTSNVAYGRYVYSIDANIGNIVVRIEEGIAVVNPGALANGITPYTGSAVPYATKEYVDAHTVSNLVNGSYVVSLDSNGDLNLPAGGEILDSNGNSIISVYTLPIASSTVLGGVKIGNNLSINATGVLSTLGNLIVVDQTISGTQINANIILSPNGTGSVFVPSLTLPVGSFVEETLPIEVSIANLTLNTVVDYSTGSGDTLAIGTVGNPLGIAHPWAIYRFTTTPTPVLELDDVIGGAGVPLDSKIIYVGTDAYSAYIVTDKVFPGAPPANGITISIVRPTVNASLSIITGVDTDIALATGGGLGVVVTHSDIVPIINNEYSLGTPTKRFNQLWLGGGTIYIADDVLGTDISLTAYNGDLVVQGGKGLEVGEFVFRDNQLFLTDPAVDIIIGTTGATAPVTFKRTIQVRNSTDEYDLLEVDQQGRVTVLSDIATDPTQAAMSIVGARTRDIQSPNNLGVLLQLTGSSTSPSRIYHDSYGAANYSAFIGRHARGNALVASQTLNNDIISRIGANPHDNTGFAGISTMRMDFVNAEDQTTESKGSKLEFWTTPIGSSTIGKRVTIDGSDIILAANANGGITFANNTRQTTAWTGAVTASNITGLATVATTGSYNNLLDKPSFISNIAGGTGILVSRSNGNVVLDATGVLSVSAAAGTGQISVANVGQRLTLTLPQGIATTSNVTFRDLTITGTLNVANLSLTTAPTVAGKLLFLAANATSNAQIDGGGIVLGPLGNTYTRTFLYNLSTDKWDTDGAGLNTLEITSDSLFVNTDAHFGNAYNDYDFPNALIQGDEDVNNYAQYILKNHSPGALASADYVAVNNIGDDSSYYIDMGINSSNYNNPDYSFSGPNDGYLYVNGGDLVIGTASIDKQINFYTDGTYSDNLRATISSAGLYVLGNISGNISTFTDLSVTNTINGNIINGVVTTGSYSNPSWITSLAGNKITGEVTSANIASYANIAVNGVVTTGSYADPSWITSLAGNKITGYVSNAIVANSVINGVYITDTGTVTNTMLAGSISNNKLLNSNIIISTSTGLSGGGTAALGSTITLINTDLGSTQNIFKTITVSGQSNVVSSLNSDVLNLVAGTGIIITTSGKNITFTGNVSSTVATLSGANNIILSGSTGNVTIQQIDGLQNIITGNTSSTYFLSTTEQYFGTTRSSTGSGTVWLPLGSTVPVGRQYIIKDEGGSSGNYFRRITVSASGSDIIDGSPTRSITSNYGALTVLWTGTIWSVI
jgi:hypothetical protein